MLGLLSSIGLFVCASLGLQARAPFDLPITKKDDLLVTKTAGYFLAPPNLITVEPVEMFEWSTDGSKLIITTGKIVASQEKSPMMPRWHRSMSEVETAAVLSWDSATGSLTTIWRHKPGQPYFQYWETMPKTDIVLGFLSDSNEEDAKMTAVTLNPRTGQFIEHKVPEGESTFPWIVVSDTELFAVVTNNMSSKELTVVQEVNLIDRTGNTTKTLFSSKTETAYILAFRGEYLYLSLLSRGPRVPIPSNNFKINVRTGKQTIVQDVAKELARPLDYLDHEDIYLEPEFEYEMSSPEEVTITSSDMLSSAPLLVSREASYAVIAPNLKNVAFVSNNLLFVRPILILKGKELEQAVEVLGRLEVINNAKQTALAIISYTADYDDVLPDPETWRKDILPYIKDESIYSEFQYTYRGERNTTKIEDPSKTELGFIPVKGGRAVAYADGSVRFVPDKKPG